MCNRVQTFLLNVRSASGRVRPTTPAAHPVSNPPKRDGAVALQQQSSELAEVCEKTRSEL
jgi:hypothetical protein